MIKATLLTGSLLARYGTLLRKDTLYVMKFLGHRSIENTMIYIDLESVCHSNGKEEYHAKTATTKEEALQLVECGFEYVCDIEGAKLFRKRK